MKFKNALAGLAFASVCSAAFAVPSFTAPGGAVYDPFGGIDWASSGSAYTTNFNFGAAVAGVAFSFDLDYFAFAKGTTGILNTLGLGFNVPNLSEGASATPGDFELTIRASFNETATCFAGGTLCSFGLNSGTFSIYLDTTPDAALGGSAALSQYTDGVLLIAGVFTAGPSGSFNALSNSGGTTLNGTVTTTNSTYINPNLVGTTATGTLQLGAAVTSWQRPSGIVGADTCGPQSERNPCSLAFQADSNQDFSIGRVPEPASIALLGFGALALGFSRRNKARA